MEYVFILVEPAVPENIGASCRAIKTMGFTSVRLINPKGHLNNEAKWLAHGSNDILENAQLFNNLSEATADIDFIIGTTAKNRSVKLDYYSPEEANTLIKNKKDSINKVAIVFGREESGLTNEELNLCDIAVSIPLFAPYPSINLAQSVMIMSYSLSKCELKNSISKNNTSDFTFLKQKAKRLLKSININEQHNLYGRIMERISIASDSDINIMLSVINKIEKKLTN
ncbi:MAG: tRNA/rRNA methyltransferase [Salinivirgaceae bacterium]|nr:tRNA/rRNA methyltransferase [Salinivirgaceae bacterium]